MEVRLVYFEGCPNWQIARRRLRRALDLLGLTDLAITLVRVGTEQEAAATGFAGSPTILIGGLDLFPPSAAWRGGLTCRLYASPAGSAGAPTGEAIMNALRERV